MREDERTFGLLQLADSVLPTGAYAFSTGLEAAFQMRWIADAESLAGVLETALFQVGRGELPFVHSCYAAGRVTAEYVDDVIGFYDAMTVAPATRKGSITLGRTWVRLMRRLGGPGELDAFIDGSGSPPHFTPVFGFTMRGAGYSREAAMRLFVHQFLRDQLSAAVRMGVCGPMEAAEIHAGLQEACRKATNCRTFYDDAERWTPAWEMAQGLHGGLYSRLFQN